MEFGHYVIAVVVPFTDLTSPHGFTINLLYQIIYLLNIYGVLYIFILLFITFTEHTMTELKVIHAVAEKIGEYEEQELQMVLLVKENDDIKKERSPTKSSKLLRQIFLLHLGVLR